MKFFNSIEKILITIAIILVIAVIVILYLNGSLGGFIGLFINNKPHTMQVDKTGLRTGEQEELAELQALENSLSDTTNAISDSLINGGDEGSYINGVNVNSSNSGSTNGNGSSSDGTTNGSSNSGNSIISDSTKDKIKSTAKNVVGVVTNTASGIKNTVVNTKPEADYYNSFNLDDRILTYIGNYNGWYAKGLVKIMIDDVDNNYYSKPILVYNLGGGEVTVNNEDLTSYKSALQSIVNQISENDMFNIELRYNKYYAGVKDVYITKQ